MLNYSINHFIKLILTYKKLISYFLYFFLIKKFPENRYWGHIKLQ